MNEPQLHDTVIDGGQWHRIVAFSEDYGTKLSDGRWVCASKFVPITRACWKYEPQPAPPVDVEAELFEELWSMEYRICGDQAKAKEFARDYLNRYARALAERPTPSYRAHGTRTAAYPIDPEATP